MATLTNNVFAKELTDAFAIGATVSPVDGTYTAVGPRILVVNADPNGTAGVDGSLALRTNGSLFVNGGGTTWTQVAAPTGGGDLTILRGSLTASSLNFAAGTNTQQKFTGVQPAIPAADLTVGTTIRVRVAGTIKRAVAANLTLALFGNDALTATIGTATLTDPPNTGRFVFSTLVTIRQVPPGQVDYAQLIFVNTAVASNTNAVSAPFLANQPAAITLAVTWTVANAGNNVDIDQFIVESATN